MTLTQIAKELNVTTMTIYRRLQKNGLKIADLRDDTTGELTPEGVSVIGSLFSMTGQQTAQQTDTTRALQDAQRDDTDVAVLRERVRGLEDALKRADAECDRLRSENDRLLSVVQDAQRQTQLLLTDGQRRGLFSWLRRRNT